MRLNRDRIKALIPHAGAMCLIDAVVAWDVTHIHCRSSSHRSAAHPLRQDGRLDAIHLIEYAAQSAAIHAGLLAVDAGAARPASGVLAALRNVRMADVDLAAVTAPLDIESQRRMGAAAGLIYGFEVTSAGDWLMSGQLTVMTRAAH